MSTSKIQNAKEICEAFEHPASSFKINKVHPTKTELQEAFRKIEANAIGITCVEPECGEFGWSTMIAKESEWKNYHAELQTEDNKEAAIATALAADPSADTSSVVYTTVAPTASSIPALPTFPNPGRFKPIDTWTDKQRGVEKIEHDQKMESYLIARNVDKALVMLLKEVFNESLWADLNKGSRIGSSALRNIHTARQIRNHLEKKFDKERPVDVDEVMQEFRKVIDTAQPIEKYFERQQLCQDLLADTKEPIREASMKRTAIGHLQKLPHMVRNVREYERDEDADGKASYETLRDFFIAREIEHIEDRATLGQEETANAAATEDKLEELHYELANLASKNAELEEAIITIANTIGESKKVAAAAERAPSPSSVSDIDKLVAALTTARNPPDTTSEQAPSALESKLQELLDDLKDKKKKGRRAKKPRKPNPKFKFYCDSHGCNASHNSDGCENKKCFHDDSATFSNPNPKLGIMWNKDIYTGPGSGL